MRIYEELFILKTGLPEEEVTALIDQVAGVITTGGGTIDKNENWGVRKLAYRVKKQIEGIYVLIQFTSGPTVVKEIERRLRVNDNVLKFITVRIDEKLKKVEKRKKQREKRAARKPVIAAPLAPIPALAPALPAAPAAPAPAMPADPNQAVSPTDEQPVTAVVAPEAAPETAPETKTETVVETTQPAAPEGAEN